MDVLMITPGDMPVKTRRNVSVVSWFICRKYELMAINVKVGLRAAVRCSWGTSENFATRASVFASCCVLVFNHLHNKF